MSLIYEFRAKNNVMKRMLSLDDYLQSPCSTSSIPYWKIDHFPIPEDMKIIHDRDFDDALLSDYYDEPYFRIFHNLKNIPPTPCKPENRIRPVDFQTEIALVRDIINASYEDIQVSEDYVIEMMSLPVFFSEGWIIVEEIETSIPVGLGIADLDTEIREGMLEWIQVNPGYRGNGIGKTLVVELLNRLKGKADFATVSGQIENESNPENLYRSCGFTGDDVWHVMRKKGDK